MVHVSTHAIERYQERVRNCTEAEAIAAIDTPAVNLAANFGAPYVRIATGQRIVIENHVVVTVLPSDMKTGKLDPRRRSAADTISKVERNGNGRSS